MWVTETEGDREEYEDTTLNNAGTGGFPLCTGITRSWRIAAFRSIT